MAAPDQHGRCRARVRHGVFHGPARAAPGARRRRVALLLAAANAAARGRGVRVCPARRRQDASQPRSFRRQAGLQLLHGRHHLAVRLWRVHGLHRPGGLGAQLRHLGLVLLPERLHDAAQHAGADAGPLRAAPGRLHGRRRPGRDAADECRHSPVHPGRPGQQGQRPRLQPHHGFQDPARVGKVHVPPVGRGFQLFACRNRDDGGHFDHHYVLPPGPAGHVCAAPGGAGRRRRQQAQVDGPGAASVPVGRGARGAAGDAGRLAPVGAHRARGGPRVPERRRAGRVGDTARHAHRHDFRHQPQQRGALPGAGALPARALAARRRPARPRPREAAHRLRPRQPRLHRHPPRLLRDLPHGRHHGPARAAPRPPARHHGRGPHLRPRPYCFADQEGLHHDQNHHHIGGGPGPAGEIQRAVEFREGKGGSMKPEAVKPTPGSKGWETVYHD